MYSDGSCNPFTSSTIAAPQLMQLTSDVGRGNVKSATSRERAARRTCAARMESPLVGTTTVTRHAAGLYAARANRFPVRAPRAA